LSRKKTRAARVAADKKRQKAEVTRHVGGRVHLELYRDPTTGHPRLGLKAPIFTDDWQNQLVTAAANTAFGTLCEQPTVARAVELAQNAMAVVSELSDGFVSRAPEGAIACKPGCDHCCYQVVGVTPPEALAIVEHLRQTRSAEALARVMERVEAAHERAAGLSSSQRFSPNHPCPFLESGACSIYEVRPLACRGMNSRDAEGCAANLRDPDARAAFLTNAQGGYSFAEPIRASLAISAGLQISLSELYSLDMQPLELTAAIHILLGGSEALPAAWLAGRTPFQSARADEATNSARMRELGGMVNPDQAT
jgi:Fe-S-cluster containining protein